MFSSQKRIFANKPSLQPEPFCPYVTDLNGRMSLFRSANSHIQPGVTPHARPSVRDGKRHA